MKNKINKRKKLTVLIISAALIFAALMSWVIRDNTALMLTSIEVESGRLPEEFDGYKIAHVSDLHNAEFGAGNQKLLKLIEDTEPDMIAITGDIIDSGRTDIDVAVSFAEKAAKIAPTYYAVGNHETRLSDGDKQKLFDGLRAVGVTVLINDTEEIKKGGAEITVIGISDRDCGATLYPLGTDNTDPIPEDIPRGDGFAAFSLERLADGSGFKLLLAHHPEMFELYADKGIDLTLSGHVHGGQFRLPFVGGVFAPSQGWFPQYDSGLYTDGEYSLVVSRGLGNSVIPLRLNNRPEVILVELNKK